MHHGILVATAGFEATVAAVDARMPMLRIGTGRGSLDTLDLDPTDEGWRLAGGELEGRTYLLDTSMLLSTDGDAIVDVSRELGCLVVGCGQETTSGTYWLYAADNGHLLRAYWNSYGDMQAAWTRGDPLESEELQPLEDLDGDGLIAALATLGFDYEAWASRDDLRELTYDLGDAEVAEGALAAELEAFRDSVAIAQGKQQKPKVIRRDGGFDLATAPPGSGDGGGLLGFVRRLLGGGGSSDRPALPGLSPAPPSTPSSRARRASSPASAQPSSRTPPRQPKPTPIADMPPGRKQFYLEYVGGNSAKFYAASLEEEDGRTWRVRFNFGRIGFPRAWDTRLDGATWAKASTAYMALIDEKLGKGYEPRPWPSTLKLPDGATLELEHATGADVGIDQTLFRAQKRGTLPPETGGSIAGLQLSDGTLYAPQPEGGSRGEDPVIWASNAPVRHVGRLWAQLAAAFPETGVWPFVIDSSYSFQGFGEYLMDLPRGRHTEVATILRRNWGSGLEGYDDDEADPENVAPFGRQFPGLAVRTPGERATSIDPIVASLEGHLGLVAVNRPADALDAVGWMGATNYDFDPLDMSTVLRSWEVRFDAYVIGLGTDTLTLAVGRPPLDLDAALAIAAEHFAFCSDNIDQGAESIAEYAPMLVGAPRWDFWWD
jgi:predicted DNA-binding WGR domain protein